MRARRSRRWSELSSSQVNARDPTKLRSAGAAFSSWRENQAALKRLRTATIGRSTKKQESC
jgi:hypothetical protein